MPASKTGFFVLILVFILSACQTAEPSLQGGIVPTRMATGTPTATPPATATATATNTPTPTLTPTQVIPTEQIGNAFNFTANGNLTSNDWRVYYTFAAETGDSITVKMNTNTPRLDPLLILQDAEGNRLFENDDSNAGSDNAAILNYVIENDGEYTLVATRRGEANSPYIGDYQLSYLRLPSSYYDPVNGIALRPIEINTGITGEISAESFYVAYIFTGATGDIVSVAMDGVAGDLDAYLILVNRRTRTILAENDDDNRSETTNAYISNIMLPENGEYIVLASRYQGADGLSTGTFTLLVSKAE